MKSEAQKIIEDSLENGIKKALQPIVHWVLIGWVLCILGSVFLSQTGFGRDNTDGAKRSGMALRTDYGTGCQYLETTEGGITPRLDVNGNHKGCYK